MGKVGDWFRANITANMLRWTILVAIIIFTVIGLELALPGEVISQIGLLAVGIGIALITVYLFIFILITVTPFLTSSYTNDKKQLLAYTIFIIISVMLIFLTNETPAATPAPPAPVTSGTLFSTITYWIKTGVTKTISITDTFIDKNLGFLKEGINKVTGLFPKVETPYLWNETFWTLENL